jgi:hypothetical protein
MSRVLAIVFAVLLAPSMGTNDCTLPCRNGGVCTLGTGEYKLDSVQNTDNMGLHFDKQMLEQFCKCPTGWIGSACEIKYISCPTTTSDNNNSNDQSQSNRYCSNGAPCEMAKDDTGKTSFWHCECDAVQSDLSSTAANYLCERSTTVYCSSSSVDPVTGKAEVLDHSYCYNGGRCNALISSSDQA